MQGPHFHHQFGQHACDMQIQGRFLGAQIDKETAAIEQPEMLVFAAGDPEKMVSTSHMTWEAGIKGGKTTAGDLSVSGCLLTLSQLQSVQHISISAGHTSAQQ